MFLAIISWLRNLSIWPFLFMLSIFLWFNLVLSFINWLFYNSKSSIASKSASLFKKNMFRSLSFVMALRSSFLFVVETVGIYFYQKPGHSFYLSFFCEQTNLLEKLKDFTAFIKSFQSKTKPFKLTLDNKII